MFLLYGWQTKVVYPYFQPGLIEGSSPVRISNTPQAGFEPAENLNSGLVEWSCAVVINNTLQYHHYNHYIGALYVERLRYEFATCLSCLFVSLILLCRFVLILPGTHLSQEKKKVTRFAYFLETLMYQSSIFWMNMMVFIKPNLSNPCQVKNFKTLEIFTIW